MPYHPLVADLREVIDRAYGFGMGQIGDEILPFAAWVAAQTPHHIIEIGTEHGGLAYLFGCIASGTVISIDWPEGEGGIGQDAAMERNRRLKRELPNFRGILGDSHAPETVTIVEHLLKGDAADLLFIDGDHTYAGVKADYDAYRPFVKPGGWIGFHDICGSPRLRALGYAPDRVWQEAPGGKLSFQAYADWGGIGLVQI